MNDMTHDTPDLKLIINWNGNNRVEGPMAADQALADDGLCTDMLKAYKNS